MLIIPFDRRISWDNAPIATLALVLANVLLFFTLQGGEDRRLDEAIEYYFESGLYQLEFPPYLEALERRGEPYPDLEPGADEELPQDVGLLFALQTDPEFQARIEAEQIVGPDDPAYPDWKRQRARFESLLSEVPAFELGLKTGAVELSDLFLHMFLHADLSHLIGNMFFLFAVGFMVEAALGRGLFLGSYLLAGLGSAALTIAFDPHGLIPSIGASGAIAGLMGLYAVLFGRRKVRFFYFLVVYFDYVRAPAYLLLVLWLGNEIYQQVVWSDFSNVNYMAHIGGLLSGAILGWVYKARGQWVDEDYLDQKDTDERRGQQLERAETHIKALDFAKALPILRSLVEQHPGDRELLCRLYDAAKHVPDSEDYHWGAQRVLGLGENDAATGRLVLETYLDYLKRARPKPRLGPRYVTALADRFLSDGELDHAERLVRVMLSNPKSFPRAPAYLARLGTQLMRNRQAKKGRAYLSYLLERFPSAPEVAIAQELLR